VEERARSAAGLRRGDCGAHGTPFEKGACCGPTGRHTAQDATDGWRQALVELFGKSRTANKHIEAAARIEQEPRDPRKKLNGLTTHATHRLG